MEVAHRFSLVNNRHFAGFCFDREADECEDESLLSCISYILYIEEKTRTLIYTKSNRVLPGDDAIVLHLFSQEDNTRSLIGR